MRLPLAAFTVILAAVTILGWPLVNDTPQGAQASCQDEGNCATGYVNGVISGAASTSVSIVAGDGGQTLSVVAHLDAAVRPIDGEGEVVVRRTSAEIILSAPIVFTRGHGQLMLSSRVGDDLPLLQEGDLLEIYDPAGALRFAEAFVDIGSPAGT